MTTAVRARSQAPGRTADRVGRGLLALDAVAALGAFAGGLATVAVAADDRLLVEGWRTFGFLVFAAMWAMLALRPRRSPGVWELILLHKVAMALFALAILPAPEAATSLAVDVVLVATTVVAYVLCRGWLSWQVWRDAPA